MTRNLAPRTFKDFDKFQLTGFRDQLLAFLETERRLVDGSLVISLEAPFGSGKSTFFEMLQSWLEEERKTDTSTPLVVYLNAWESDHSGDPILAIVSELADSLRIYLTGEQKKSLTKMKKVAGQVFQAALSMTNDYVKERSKIDVAKAIKESTKPETKGLNGLEIFKSYETKKKSLVELRKTLETVVGHEVILLIVDELDRCRPNYAIEYLESIKHLFNQKGMIFLLGIDRGQMEASTKSLYGNGINFNEYFRKFSHRSIKLPSISDQNSMEFCRYLANHYLKEDLQSSCPRYRITEFDDARIKNVSSLLYGFGLTGRSSHEAMRVMAHAIMSPTPAQTNKDWGYVASAIFMAIIATNNPSLYEKIGSQKSTPQDILDTIDKLKEGRKNKANKEWWKKLLILAHHKTPENSQPNEALHKLFLDFKLTEIRDIWEFIYDVRQTAYSFGGYSDFMGPSVLEEIHNSIETLKKFEN